MQVFGLKSAIVQPNDDLIAHIIESLKIANLSLQNKDILVLSETVVATTQGRMINLKTVKEIRPEAVALAKQYLMDPRLVELVFQESAAIIGGVDHVLLAEVGGILIANAGIDLSNAGGDDNAVFLPRDLQKTADQIRRQLEQRFNVKIGIILADSRVQPLKVGIIGMALAVSGFQPIIDCRGRKDLFGREIRIKQMAVADDIASAAVLLMGECDESIPFGLVRGAPVKFTDDSPVSMVMLPTECLFMNIFAKFFANIKEKAFQGKIEKS